MKKRIIFVGAVAMLAATLTSCGGERQIEVQKPELTTIAALKEKYNENNKIKIDLWTGFGQAMSDALDGVLEDFEREYPYIDVNHEQKSGYDNLHSGIMNSLYTSSYPNVAVGYPDHFADYISSNIQYALDDFVNSEEYGIDLSDYYEQYMTENKTLLYKDDAKKDPYIMGIPFNKSTEVMVYNKTFFDAFGLTVPTTWDEAVTVGKEIIKIVKGTSSKLTNDADKVNHFGTEWNYNGTVFDFKDVQESAFYPLSYDSQANFFITIVKQFGGKYTEMGENIKKGYMVFKDDPKVIEALNFVKSMNTDHVLGIPSVWDETSYCSNPFKMIKSVMTISSSAGVANNIPAGNKFEVGIAPIPYKTADKKFVISQGTNLAIFKSDAEHALASWLLIRFMTGGVEYEYKELDEATGEYKVVIDENTGNPIMDNANVNFAIDSGYLPVTKKGEQSDRYQQYIGSVNQGSASDKAKIAVQKIASEVYVNNENPSETWDKFVDAAFIGSSTIRTEVDKIIPFMITGASGKIYTAEEAIDFVYRRCPSYVK